MQFVKLRPLFRWLTLLDRVWCHGTVTSVRWSKFGITMEALDMYIEDKNHLGHNF